MRRALQRVARRLWGREYGLRGTLLVAVLTPLSVLWAVVTRHRNRRWDREPGARIDGLAVVSIGNIAVGGTGKTPVSSWVATRIAEAGGRPAIVLRGYGADEIDLHRLWHPEIDVVADVDRVQGSHRARDEGANVAVLDDGFQHRRLARDLDVVLLATEDRFPGRLLPSGPYREGARSLRRADVVILTRRSASVEDARRLQVDAGRYTSAERRVAWACLRLSAGPLRRLVISPDGAASWTGPASAPDHGPGRRPLAGPFVLTAVARPDAVLHDVAGLSTDTVGILAFEDHHVFTEADVRAAVRRASGRPIVVTEKDAVKLAPFAELLGESWVLTQRLEWDWGEDAVRSRLDDIVASTRRVSTPQAPIPSSDSPFPSEEPR